MVKLVYPRTPTHKDCINFRDGVCTLYGIPVNPNQPACPNFTPKTAVTTPTTTYQQPQFRGFGFGRGMWRFRMGLGFQPFWYGNPPGVDIAFLEDRLRFLEEQLKQVRKRLEELKRFG